MSNNLPQYSHKTQLGPCQQPIPQAQEYARFKTVLIGGLPIASLFGSTDSAGKESWRMYDMRDNRVVSGLDWEAMRQFLVQKLGPNVVITG